jgi:hypothetical protein
VQGCLFQPRFHIKLRFSSAQILMCAKASSTRVILTEYCFPKTRVVYAGGAVFARRGLAADIAFAIKKAYII